MVSILLVGYVWSHYESLSRWNYWGGGWCLVKKNSGKSWTVSVEYRVHTIHVKYYTKKDIWIQKILAKYLYRQYQERHPYGVKAWLIYTLEKTHNICNIEKVSKLRAHQKTFSIHMMTKVSTETTILDYWESNIKQSLNLWWI